MQCIWTACSVFMRFVSYLFFFLVSCLLTSRVEIIIRGPLRAQSRIKLVREPWFASKKHFWHGERISTHIGMQRSHLMLTIWCRSRKSWYYILYTRQNRSPGHCGVTLGELMKLVITFWVKNKNMLEMNITCRVWLIIINTYFYHEYGFGWFII